jgi:Uma2 family endonuclease
MATEVSPLPVETAPRCEPERERLVLYDVSWDFYERFLEEIGDRRLRLTYDDGTLEIMTVSKTHENWAELIARLIGLLSLELNIPICSAGSMTSKRKKVRKGLEPDKCYYIQHESMVRAREVDLERDPPPDLALEVDISYRTVRRDRIYAALGVPELWRFDGQRLHFAHLSAKREYEPREASLAFPMLRAADLQRFLILDPSKDETTLMREFRDWVRATLVRTKESR